MDGPIWSLAAQHKNRRRAWAPPAGCTRTSAVPHCRNMAGMERSRGKRWPAVGMVRS